jgi:GT2 family glycosyltransferase
MNQYTTELEELAESMRIKNRLKRLPSSIANFFKKKLFFFSYKIGSFNINSFIKKLKRVKFNRSVFKKLFYYLKRGEFKYLAQKAYEKIKKNLFSSKKFLFIDLKDYFTKQKKITFSNIGKEPIDIIIPVYNGYEYLEPLLISIKENTSHPYRLIVIDDASPDKRVVEILKAMLVEHEETLFLQNSKNLGFVKSVNRAVKEVRGDFVILNTDTEVPPFWLERLIYPIKHLPKVASTTPFTNSGTIASFPKFLEDNEIFENLDLKVLDSLFFDVNALNHYAKAPTGVGFCMGVNYALVKEIGFFDEESFLKGYGEENDWCQRAIKKGYSNLIVPNLFVYHKHGGSFSSDLKERLLQENYQTLIKKHPTYPKQVQDYISKDPHKILRELLVITASSKKEPLFVVFDHFIGGGANYYLDKLLDSKIEQNYNSLLIRYDFYKDEYKCSYRYKEYEFYFAVESIENLDILLSRCDIKELFLNSFVSYPNQKELLEYIDNLAKNKDCKITLPLHDYFAICPSYTLLDKDGKYCKVPDIEVCKSCLTNNKQEWRNFFNDEIDIVTWRELWQNLLNRAKVITFSDASKDILLKAYPNLKEIEVVPHIVDDIEPLNMPKSSNSKITIGVLGAINYAKGASIIKELVETIDKQNLNIDVVVIGQITEQINSKHFKVTGRYKKEELKRLIISNKIDIFLIPSIWPETFSYTTEEIIKMGLPLMVFNLGAPAQRVKEYEKGYILETFDTNTIIKTAKEAKKSNI